MAPAGFPDGSRPEPNFQKRSVSESFELHEPAEIVAIRAKASEGERQMSSELSSLVVKLASSAIAKNDIALADAIAAEAEARDRLRDAQRAVTQAAEVVASRRIQVYRPDSAGRYGPTITTTSTGRRGAAAIARQPEACAAGEEVERLRRVIIALRQRGATLRLRKRRAAMGVEDILREVLEGAGRKLEIGPVQTIDTAAGVERPGAKPSRTLLLRMPGLVGLKATDSDGDGDDYKDL